MIIQTSSSSVAFSTPGLAQIPITVLSILLIFIIWRAATYLANAVHFTITGELLLPENYRQVDSWGSLVIVARWMCISAILLLIIGVVAHVSRRIYIRLNLRGIVRTVFAVACWLAGATFLAYWVALQEIAFIGSIVSAIMGFSLLAAGAHQFAMARQHMALSAEEVLHTDRRQPILYLRSFSQDDETAPDRPTNPEYNRALADRAFLPGFWLNRRNVTFEEMLCRALSKIGPVIAIGQPGEALPRLGAARHYVGHEDWQVEVTRFMDLARFACIVIGRSAGVQWELEAMMRQGAPNKVLLIVPPADSSPFGAETTPRELAIRALPESVPDNTLAVFFDADWQPVIVTGRAKMGNYRKIARLMMRRSVEC